MTTKKIAIIAILRLLTGIASLTAVAHAADIYLAQSAQGAGDGSSAGNAAGLSFFNSAASWANPKVAGLIGPGDTVHLVGTFTTPLTVQGSGSAGSPITIFFEANANLTAPAWPVSGAINVGQNNYITVDGGSNGLIQNTANGDDLSIQQDSVGVSGTNANYLVVQNLSVANIYVASGGENGYGTAITDNAADVELLTGYRVTNCTIHDAYIGIGSDYGTGCSNYEFSFNTIYNVNWGGYCADRHAGATMTGLLVHDNTIYNFSNWDDSQDNFHHNGFYAWAQSGGTLNAFSFYNNTIGPNFGQDSTGGLFSSGTVVGPVLVYNNVFLEDNDDAPDNGLITVGPGPGAVVRIYNNTFVGGGSGIAVDIGGQNGGTQTYDIENNIDSGTATFIFAGSSATIAMTSANNDIYNPGSEQTFSLSLDSSGSFLTAAQWQGLGYDVDSLLVNPLLSASYVPLLGSPVILAGANFSAYFTTDKSGAARPATGPWDLGAYQYGSSATAPAAPPVTTPTTPSTPVTTPTTPVTTTPTAPSAPATAPTTPSAPATPSHGWHGWNWQSWWQSTSAGS